MTGHPVRLLRSPLVREMAKAEYEENAIEKLEALGEGSLQCAVMSGDKEKGSFMAGQCACMLNEIQPAKEIIDDLFCEQVLKEASDAISAKLCK